LADLDFATLASVLDGLNDAVVLFDEGDIVRAANASARALYGRPGQALVGARASEILDIDVDEDGEAISQAWFQAGFWSGEVQRAAGDGRALILEVRRSRLQALGGSS
jgi:PAS domain-containing protein